MDAFIFIFIFFISIVLLVLAVQELNLILHRSQSILFPFFPHIDYYSLFSRVPCSFHYVLFAYQFVRS